MPIDLDGLALIDTMLDSIIELRLMPIAWTELQAEDLKTIHESLLHLNQLWQDFDDSDYLANASFELRTPMNSIIGFTRVLKVGVDGVLPPETIPYLSTIESLAYIVLGKINYHIDKYRAKMRRP
jgi:signal transduction histidine kinase